MNIFEQCKNKWNNLTNRQKIITICMLLALCIIGNLTENKPINNTKVEQSRYNDIAPSEYYKEMKSDNLEYADIAWHAKKTYGWNCDEVTDLGEKVYTSGNEIGDSYLKSQMVGYYQVATCSSGTKLRVYPRKDTYPMITNINGGWE